MAHIKNSQRPKSSEPTNLKSTFEIIVTTDESHLPLRNPDYTLKFRYDLSNKTAETKHFTKEGDITTTTICDDLMRPVKVRKSAVVEGAAGEITSGVMTYDAFGRCVKEFLPTFNGGKSTGFSETKYDAHDRKTMSILPDGSVEKYAFEVESGNLKTTITNAENHVSESYTDARQRTVKTVRKGDIRSVRW